MDTQRMKRAAEWFYSTVFQEETIRPRQEAPQRKVPAPIRAARSLEQGPVNVWQKRESIFVKQAKLLANYEDTYEGEVSVVRYYPTYQSLTDEELRCYFAWRTKLRRGETEKTCLSFAFLYIYELLNQIGVEDPLDGYRKLKVFAWDYGQLDGKILPYLNRWIIDYVVYYELPATLLEDIPQVAFDRSVQVLTRIPQCSDDQIVQAVGALAPKWLGRSKFYSQNAQDMNAVMAGVLRGIYGHCESRCKKSMAEQFFGAWDSYPVQLFESAVFLNQRKNRTYDYAVDPVYIYHCTGGFWTVQKYAKSRKGRLDLEDLTKTIDSELRRAFHDRHPVQPALDTKWILKIIREEIAALTARKQAEALRVQEAEAKKLHLDYSKLAQIRMDAAITQEKLTVEEEQEELAFPEPPAPTPQPPEPGEDTPVLSGPEYRLVQCLLYGRDLAWIRAEGHILSVLADGVNEKLYDIFQDTVLEEPPHVVEDYVEELKEMVRP